jgi:hypothetical protein
VTIDVALKRGRYFLAAPKSLTVGENTEEGGGRKQQNKKTKKKIDAAAAL